MSAVTLTQILNGTSSVGINIQSDIMKEAVAKLLQERRNSAISACSDIIESAVATVEEAKRALRDIRRREKAQKAQLEKVGAAAQYLGETGNPLPFFLATGREREGRYFLERIGAEVTPSDSAEWKIPEGWEPKEAVCTE